MESTNNCEGPRDVNTGRMLTVDAIVKGYHECPFNVGTEDPAGQEHFRISRKRADRGNALRVHSSRGQLGHLQKELVSILWPITHKIVDW